MIEKDLVKEKQEVQILAAKVSIAGSVILFLTSLTIGLIVDSITLLLDASASLVILVVALLMHTSIKKLHRPPDDLYNFGYAKYEPLTVVVQGGLIITTCVISIKFALQDIIHAENVHSYFFPTVATFLSGVLGMFIMSYLNRAAKRTNSAILKAASIHWYTDTILSFGVCAGFLLGLLLQISGYSKITLYIDPVMAILLALILVWVPVRSIMHNVMELLDAVPAEDIRIRVVKVAENYKPRSYGVHRLRTRKAGERVFVDICFVMNNDTTVKEAGELANSFERDLKAYFGNCDVVVSFKPVR